MLKKAIAIGLLLGTTGGSAAQAGRTGSAAEGPADTVVLNARIVTVDSAFSMAEAAAIRNGRFIAVGGNVEVRALAGPQTRVIDAGGRTVIPGLIDSHVHATGVAEGEAVQRFESLTSVAAIQQWLRAQAARTPAGTWIWCPRLYPTRLKERRFPTRAELDAAAPDRPAVIDGAYALVLNTAALRAAGITRHTPDPRGGAIAKDASGEPTGLLRNVGDMLAKFHPSSRGNVLDLLEQVHRQYNRVGITSVIERGATPAGYTQYETLKQQHRLHVRSTVTIRIPRIPACPGAANEAVSGVDARPCQAQIDEITSFVKSLPFTFGQGDEMLKAGPLKVVADGGILIGTSFMRKPYGVRARGLYGFEDPEYRGFSTLTPQQLTAAVLIGQSLGWQVVAHVTGDAGVDAVLDAYEAAAKAGVTGRRHTLIHAYFVTPEVARRAARLGVPVDTQPAWYYKDADALASGLGEARLERFLGLRTWLNAGVHTAINTDHMFGTDPDTALNPFNPFLTMYAATTRQTEGGRVIGASQKVTRQEALRMMTTEAAYLSFDERDRGSIEPGKLGDLVILSDDILTCSPEKLRGMQVQQTILGGRVVYERGQ